MCKLISDYNELFYAILMRREMTFIYFLIEAKNVSSHFNIKFCAFLITLFKSILKIFKLPQLKKKPQLFNLLQLKKMFFLLFILILDFN